MPRPTHRYQTSRLPWILLFAVLVAGAGFGYYGKVKYELLANEKAKAEKRTEVAQDEQTTLDEKARSARAKLDRARVDTSTNQGRFAVDAEEAEELGKKVADIVGAKAGKVVIDGNVMIIRLQASALFAGGGAKLSEDGKRSLSDIGEFLTEMRERDVAVEGHTSDNPVSEIAKGFATNWEFTSSRANAVVRYFHDEVGIPPERLSASAFAEFRPASRTSNTKNRRIDIALVPKQVRRIDD